MAVAKERSRKPGMVTQKILNMSGEESLWFDFEWLHGMKGVCISHGKGNDFLSLTIIDEDGKNHNSHVSRDVMRKLLPFLSRFADGGDFGITKEKTA